MKTTATTQQTWEVTIKAAETNHTLADHFFETEEEARNFIEEMIDEDLETDDYETYDYYLNGELQYD